MVIEYNVIIANDTWILIPKLLGIVPKLACWVYKIKLGLNGEPPQYKGWIVARGFQQVHMVDFQETFAPTVQWESIQIITNLTSLHIWPIHHMDINTVFLNGCLYNVIFMLQPLGCVRLGVEHLLYNLNHVFYGLGRAPTQFEHIPPGNSHWFQRLLS